jgi:hypothetical protein
VSSLGRFQTVIESTTEPLPLCRKLAAYRAEANAGLSEIAGDIDDQSVAAFGEIHAAIKKTSRTSE